MRISGPEDFRSVFLTGMIQHDVVAAERFSLEGGRGVVTSFDEKWDKKQVSVRGVDRPALLVIAASPHRYWSATVDGVDSETVPVNLISTGVVLPHGARTVELRYRNPMLLRGMWISLVSLSLARFAMSAIRRLLPSADPKNDPHDVPQHL